MTRAKATTKNKYVALVFKNKITWWFEIRLIRFKGSENQEGECFVSFLKGSKCFSEAFVFVQTKACTYYLDENWFEPVSRLCQQLSRVLFNL